MRQFENPRERESRQKQIAHFFGRAFGRIPRPFHRTARRKKFSRKNGILVFGSFVRRGEDQKNSVNANRRFLRKIPFCCAAAAGARKFRVPAYRFFDFPRFFAIRFSRSLSVFLPVCVCFAQATEFFRLSRKRDVRGIEIIESFRQIIIDHAGKFFVILLLALHRQTHAAESEILFHSVKVLHSQSLRFFLFRQTLPRHAVTNKA